MAEARPTEVPPVRIGREQGFLELEAAGNFHVRAVLTVGSRLRAHLIAGPFSPYGTPPFLDRFFEGLAANWSGWDGTREWRTDDGDLRLLASHDWIGTVTIRVCIIDQHWNVEADVAVDPGSLDNIASSLTPLMDEWTPPSGTRELLNPPRA